MLKTNASAALPFPYIFHKNLTNSLLRGKKKYKIIGLLYSEKVTVFGNKKLKGKIISIVEGTVMIYKIERISSTIDKPTRVKMFDETINSTPVNFK